MKNLINLFQFINLQIILIIHFLSFIWLIYLLFISFESIIWFLLIILIVSFIILFHWVFSFIHQQSILFEYLWSMKRKTKINIKLIKFHLIFFKMISMKQSIHVIIVVEWNEKIIHWMIGNFLMFLVFFQKSKLSLKNTIFKSILLNVINNIK